MDKRIRGIVSLLAATIFVRLFEFINGQHSQGFASVNTILFIAIIIFFIAGIVLRTIECFKRAKQKEPEAEEIRR